MSHGDPPTTVLAVTGIKDRCYIDGCDAAAVGVAAYHSTTERDVVLVWLCAEHSATFTPPADATTDLLVQEITRTCRQGEAGKAPCGGYATHVVVVGQEYTHDRAPKIRVISNCERHAGEVAEDRLPRDTA